MNAEEVSFETELGQAAEGEQALVVDVEGFEGPLDLLLTLARQQKVDLAKISILALADQYLAFIEAARALRLELAADYLVMAAWLAYLKSRLLLPEQQAPEGLSAEDMANALAQRLRRLEGIRQVAEQLLNRPQLGREVFQRGQPEPIAEIKRPQWTATLYDLLSAYASRRQNEARSHVRMPSARCGRWPRRARRSSGWSVGLLTGARWTSICSNIWSSRRSGPRCSPRALRRPWNWCVRAGSKSISIRRLRRCLCAPASRRRKAASPMR
jgi:hypothetical protein